MAMLEVLGGGSVEDRRVADALQKSDGEGYTALHVAIIHRSLECVQILMRLGADPSASVEVRRDGSKRRGKRQSVTSNAFAFAARCGDARIVDAVFFPDPGAAASLAEKSPSDFREAVSHALISAARVGDPHALEAALRSGASSRFRGGGRFGKTAAETAAGRGALAAFRVLSRPRRARSNPSGSDGVFDGALESFPSTATRASSRTSASALEWAAYSGCDATVRAALEAGDADGDAPASARRIAETRGASLRVRRILRGRS
jgi:ankyrin repeat protein